MTRFLIAVVLSFTLTTATASAEGTIQSEVARTGVWANTQAYTPIVYGSGSSPCRRRMTVRQPASNTGGVTPNVQQRLADAPIPCWFQPAPGTDGEAVIQNQTATGYDYTELWKARYNDPAAPWAWSVGWGGAANTPEMTDSEGVRVWPGWMGTQASGIAFLPGVPRISELQAHRIAHPVQVEVPEACTYHKPPATRHDSSAGGANCIPEGQKYKLPPGTDCSTLRPLARDICTAARDYYLVVTDQTHDKVTFRLEGVQPSSSPYYDGDPYHENGGLFGCDGLFNGQPAAAGSEFDCYPNEKAVFKGFPWAALEAAN